MGNTFDKFKIGGSRSSSGLQKPKIGGGANSMTAFTLAMMKNQMQQQQNQETTQGIGEVMNQVNSQFPGGTPKDMTLNVGKNTTANIKLNPSLNEGERQDIATARSLEPVVQRIREKILGGRLKSDYGDVGRTTRQLRVDSGEPIITSGSDLQDLQSDFNALKSILPFTSGGKQLTGIEKKLVFHLLNTTGKSDENILKDIDTAMNVVSEKERLAVGGINALNSQEQQSSPDDDRMGRLERIKQRFKEKNP